MDGELKRRLTVIKETLEEHPHSWELDAWIKRVIEEACKGYPDKESEEFQVHYETKPWDEDDCEGYDEGFRFSETL